VLNSNVPGILTLVGTYVRPSSAMLCLRISNFVFAGNGHGELGDELDVAWNFVVGNLPTAEVPDVLLPWPGAIAQGNPRHDFTQKRASGTPMTCTS
jgi:hypothetical protein